MSGLGASYNIASLALDASGTAVMSVHPDTRKVFVETRRQTSGTYWQQKWYPGERPQNNLITTFRVNTLGLFLALDPSGQVTLSDNANDPLAQWQLLPASGGGAIILSPGDPRYDVSTKYCLCATSWNGEVVAKLYNQDPNGQRWDISPDGSS